MDFASIGRSTGTDKVTHHGYHRFYPRYLEEFRDTATGILEIGIDRKCSVELWKAYFPNAHVYGIDIGFEHTEPRVTIRQADQSSRSDLESVRAHITHPIQCIVDDGSHIPEHQLSTLNYFFPKLLEPGGVYIVEDIETSYWTRGDCYGYPTNYGFKHPQSFVEQSKALIDSINSEFLDDSCIDTQFSAEVRAWMSSIAFGQNCVIFQKKMAHEMDYSNRVYRFQHNLL